MVSKILINVITSFYNSEEFMEATYKSLLNQTYTNWEWICVDDKSTDNTLKILQEWAKKDSRIKVIPRDKNGGNAAFGFNSGLPYCNGSHTQILGHDDELTPDTLEEIVKRINETNADVVIPDVEEINDLLDPYIPNIKRIGIQPFKQLKDYPLNDRNVVLTPLEAFCLSLNWRIHGWACYSTELLKKYKYHEKGMNGDEYSSREFLLNSNKVVFSKGTYQYKRRKGSITVKINPRYFDRFECEEKLQELMDKNNIEKKYKRLVNRNLLNTYFNCDYKYFTNKDSFSNEEKQQIEKMLHQGQQLIHKYCSIYDIIKIKTRLFKYKTLYYIYKSIKSYLEKKNLINN